MLTLYVMCFALQRFSAAVMRLRDPKTTALLFRSGKVGLGSLRPLLGSLEGTGVLGADFLDATAVRGVTRWC